MFSDLFKISGLGINCVLMMKEVCNFKSYTIMYIYKMFFVSPIFQFISYCFAIEVSKLLKCFYLDILFQWIGGSISSSKRPTS